MFHPSPRPGLLLLTACLLATRLFAAEPATGWIMDFNEAALGPVSDQRIKTLSPVPVLWAGGFARRGVDGRFRVKETAGHGRALQERRSRRGAVRAVHTRVVGCVHGGLRRGFGDYGRP